MDLFINPFAMGKQLPISGWRFEPVDNITQWSMLYQGNIYSQASDNSEADVSELLEKRE